jgi:hypothetical protein
MLLFEKASSLVEYNLLSRFRFHGNESEICSAQSLWGIRRELNVVEKEAVTASLHDGRMNEPQARALLCHRIR